MSYSNEELLKMYKQMQLSRIFEEKLLQVLSKGELPGFCHLAMGQEAVHVGALCAMGENDYLVPTHRNHPSLVNKLDTKKYICELLGKYDGFNKGKAWEHISSKDDKTLPVSGDLGVGVPLAAGFAWALKAQKEDAVVVAFCGDGASSEGNVHEGMNLAALFNCPVVFVLENNQYAISTHVSRQTKAKKLSDRAAGYGLTGITVDGNDVIKVRESIEAAIAKAKKGEPSVVEAVTYRWRSHFEGDPALYRDPQESQDAMKNCPIKKLREQLMEKGVLNDKLVKSIDNELRNQVDDAFEFAKNSPVPTEEQTVVYDEVYASDLGGVLV